MKKYSVINIIFIISVLILSFKSFGQNQITNEQLNKTLDTLSLKQAGLNNRVQLNVSNIEMVDLLNSIGLENNLNLSVDPNLIQLVTYNFYDVPVKEVFSFLYRNYNIEINFIGSIISFKNKPKEKEVQVKYIRKTPDVSFNAENNFLTVDLRNDTLEFVAHEITKQSGLNIVMDNQIKYNPM